MDETKNKINIKKRKIGRPIYYGVSDSTGELMTVDDVERGLACQCTCPACGTRLEARKGEVKRHHFAHESNKECLYGAEVVIYRAFYELLRKKRYFVVPDAMLTFNSGKRPETVKRGGIIPLTNVQLNDDQFNYPPELLCYSGNNCLRIVLNIEMYFNADDYRMLKEHGKQDGMAIIAVDICDLDDVTTFSALQRYLDSPNDKVWVFNRVVEEWERKYREAAVAPARFGERHICFAQRFRYLNVYAARTEECRSCPYCFDDTQEAFCLAPSFIDHIEDFQKSEHERRVYFEQVNQIEPIKRIDEYQCPVCGAPMKRRTGPKGIFAGCSNYPNCRGSRNVEPNTEQVILNSPKRYK